jgi:hypothetical protein
MPRKPDDELTTRETLVFCAWVLALTAGAYLLVVWLLPLLVSR